MRSCKLPKLESPGFSQYTARYPQKNQNRNPQSSTKGSGDFAILTRGLSFLFQLRRQHRSVHLRHDCLHFHDATGAVGRDPEGTAARIAFG